MRHRKFNLWCFLFGHKWWFPFETTEYKTYNNSMPTGFKRTMKKRRKVKVVKRWHKCSRCGKVERIKKQ